MRCRREWERERESGRDRERVGEMRYLTERADLQPGAGRRQPRDEPRHGVDTAFGTSVFR